MASSVFQLQKPLRDARALLRYSRNEAMTALYPEDIAELLQHFQAFRQAAAGVADQAALDDIYMTLDNVERDINTRSPPSEQRRPIDQNGVVQGFYDDVVAMIDECHKLAPYFDAQKRQAKTRPLAATPATPRRMRRRS